MIRLPPGSACDEHCSLKSPVGSVIAQGRLVGCLTLISASTDSDLAANMCSLKG